MNKHHRYIFFAERSALKSLMVFPLRWLSPDPRISTPLGWADYSRPCCAVIPRWFQREKPTTALVTLASSFRFISTWKHRNLIKIKSGGAGDTCGMFRALTLVGGLCSAELCSWTAVAGLAWVKPRGEFSSAVTWLGLKWRSFTVMGLGVLCDSGKEIE